MFTHIHRAKHPVKVHVWAAISKRGASGICIFEGIMVKEVYVDILERTLLPFIHDVFPDGHRFMQDNDPKHVSKLAKEFLRTHNVNWWTTPPESPDANPIENLWHELKEFIRREVKPRNKQELIAGLVKFWGTVDVAKCRRYIRHLRKVVPKIIECNGEATGY